VKSWGVADGEVFAEKDVILPAWVRSFELQAVSVHAKASAIAR
jgi:hypothetical protein